MPRPSRPPRGSLPWGTQPAGGPGAQSQTLAAAQPLEAGGQEQSQAHRRGGQKHGPGAGFFPFRGCAGKGRVLLTLCALGHGRGPGPPPHHATAGPRGKPAPLLPHKSSPVAVTPADGSSAPALPKSSPAARHGEGGRSGLRPPPPRRAVLPEPGSESSGRAGQVLLQLPDEKDQERQCRRLLPHQPRVPSPGCDLQGEEREGDLRPGEQGLGEEVPAKLPSQLLLHPQLGGWPGAARGVPSTGDRTPRR